MIFGYFTLFVALVISAVAAYYSIVGLTAIFSAAVIPILIMGASLEVGKVTAAVWLKLNWYRANFTYKLYLVPAVAFLMLLTSMGIFGFLSKAHSDQSLVSGDSMAKVAIYDEKIKIAKDNIDANRKALKQMDEAVDQVMGRSADEKGADKAVAIRRGQQKERARLLAEIQAEQTTIGKLNEERAPLAAENRKIESEVGPIKYIAALVYGDNPDNGILEKAVRLVIIIIVAVFDPLALVLILAAQQSIKWAREEREAEEEHTPYYVADVGEKPTAKELAEGLQDEDEINEVNEIKEDNTVINDQIDETNSDPHSVGWMYNAHKGTFEETIVALPEEELAVDKYAYLKQPFVHFGNLAPMVATKEEPADKITTVVSVQEEDRSVEITKDTQAEEINTSEGEPEPKILAMGIDVVDRPGDYVSEPVVTKTPEARRPYKAPLIEVPETLNVRRASALQADNVEGNQVHSSFGTKFPESADKGDMFLRVDYLPNKLFKYNGFKWIEVDKARTDSYTYDEQYILFLIDKLQSGEYEIDQLSASEQELVADKLQQIANDKS